jgi:hypothetical protein
MRQTQRTPVILRAWLSKMASAGKMPRMFG